MQLQCTLESKVDFVPMLKSPRFWQPKSTLKAGSVLEVEEDIGHQLLATYPKCFKVLAYAEKKTRNKKVDEASLQHGAPSEVTAADALGE